MSLLVTENFIQYFYERIVKRLSSIFYERCWFVQPEINRI